jgi:predicted O-methyltransferase YrrM
MENAMDRLPAEELITELYRNVLGREPALGEFENWVKSAMTEPPQRIVKAFFACDEFVSKNAVHSVFAPGHYHSPVVDPKTVTNYVARERGTVPDEIQGVAIAVEAMRKLWLRNLDCIQSTPFTDDATPAYRYSYLGGPFPNGDAIALWMMIHHHRPRRIVEIGSGYSTACMLDSAEHASLSNLKVTCIEPDPARLRSILRPGDLQSVVKLIERPVQEVSVEIVDCLQKDDILFIDSTHVMKTGSDVHYEFFHLIPRLRPGVIIHFHDIGFPFEYPPEWIFDRNYSWNEAYVLRAFLMYNPEFRVVFWNPVFASAFTESIQAEFPAFLTNPGGSIWIERVATS